MTAHFSLPQLHDSELDQRLGEEITLLAGQSNAATHRPLILATCDTAADYQALKALTRFSDA